MSSYGSIAMSCCRAISRMIRRSNGFYLENSNAPATAVWESGVQPVSSTNSSITRIDELVDHAARLRTQLLVALGRGEAHRNECRRHVQQHAPVACHELAQLALVGAAMDRGGDHDRIGVIHHRHGGLVCSDDLDLDALGGDRRRQPRSDPRGVAVRGRVDDRDPHAPSA